MSLRFVSPEEAEKRSGLRMVVVGGVPSPWGEAAKGLFHVKGLDWAAVKLDLADQQLTRWTGSQSAPVVFYDNEAPRSGWADLLLLAERLAPTPALIPADPEDRALMFGLAHEICGEEGLGWARRVQLIDAGLKGAGGFAPPVAQYLAPKYGYSEAAANAAGARVTALLSLFADRLREQEKADSPYYIGSTLTALDVYSATFMAMFGPLAEEHCAIHPALRTAFTTLDPDTKAALDPILLQHRDRIYQEHLKLPMEM